MYPNTFFKITWRNVVNTTIFHKMIILTRNGGARGGVLFEPAFNTKGTTTKQNNPKSKKK